MKVPLLARLILWAFLAIFASAAGYVLLDSLGLWQRIPASASRGVEVLTGLILLAALAGHLTRTALQQATTTAAPLLAPSQVCWCAR